MGEVISVNDNVPAVLQSVFGSDQNDDLSSGLSGGFGVMSIKGSKFRAKFGGDSTLITNEDGDPKASLEVIILKASPHVAKTFYHGDYTEGSSSEPDCYSLDGEKPSSKSPDKQADLCAICPQAKWGSKKNAKGDDIKACGDSRRVSVVPAGDVDNEQWGGPMLLRIPVMSLGDLATYGRAMKAKGFPYNTVVTRLSFDTDVAYPKLMFKAARPVNEEQAAAMMRHFESGKLDSILSEEREVTAKTASNVAASKPKTELKPKATVDTAFDEEPAPTKAAPKKAKKKAPTKIKAVEVEHVPDAPPTTTADSELDSELDDLFASMEGDS